MIGGERWSGADRFLLLIDRELRRRGLRGFQAVLAIELEPAPGDADPDAFGKPLAAAFEQLLGEMPRGRARLARWLGLGPLRLTTRRSSGAESFQISSRSTVPPHFCFPDLHFFASERLNAPLDPARDPWIDLAVERPPDATRPTRLVLRWWHPAMDARGAELLLKQLSQRVAAASEPGRTDAPPFDEPALPKWKERHAAFRSARRRLEELTQREPFQLAAAANGARGAGPHAADWQAESELLSPSATARFLAASDAEYGVRGEGLAQTGLLFQALADLAPQHCELALPVSVQLRPPRARGPIGGNALSFLWYALAADVARDRGACARTLRSLARAKVAAGEERDAAAMLDLGRFLPLPLYRRELARKDGGARFSASLSTLGELFAGARELFGRRVRDALALTAFPAPPGVGVVFSRANGALRIVTLHAPALVDPAAAHRLHERLVARARGLAGGE